MLSDVAVRLTGSARPSDGTSVTNRHTLRFAVGVFDGWQAVRETARDLSSGSAGPNLSCLALESTMARRTVAADDFDPGAMTAIAFGDEADRIFCTGGPVAARVKKIADDGASTLQAALGRWLIGRHAAQLADAVRSGKIIAFVQILNDVDERSAYRSLLSRSSHSVGVHDLIG